MLTAHAPLLAPGGTEVPRILHKFSRLTVALVSQIDNFQSTAKIPFRWPAWVFVVPGLVLAALAACALIFRRPQYVTEYSGSERASLNA